MLRLKCIDILFMDYSIQIYKRQIKWPRGKLLIIKPCNAIG